VEEWALAYGREESLVVVLLSECWRREYLCRLSGGGGVGSRPGKKKMKFCADLLGMAEPAL